MLLLHARSGLQYFAALDLPYATNCVPMERFNAVSSDVLRPNMTGDAKWGTMSVVSTTRYVISCHEVNTRR